jgi:hypothetical protein
VARDPNSLSHKNARVVCSPAIWIEKLAGLMTPDYLWSAKLGPVVALDVEFPVARQERVRLVLEEVVGAAALARMELKRAPAKNRA